MIASVSSAAVDNLCGSRGQLRALNRLCVLGARQDLPASRDFHELDTVTVDVVVQAQLLECRFERRLPVFGVLRDCFERIDWNGSSAREERRFKQLR